VNKFDSGFAIGGCVDGIAGALQTALQEVGNPLFVFNDKEAHRRLVARDTARFQRQDVT
jgi:hypothetical protein